MTEQRMYHRVVGRISALGLPTPTTETKSDHVCFDLAWPDQRVAVEIARTQKPMHASDWTMGQVNPTMTDDQIDKVLKALPL